MLSTTSLVVDCTEVYYGMERTNINLLIKLSLGLVRDLPLVMWSKQTYAKIRLETIDFVNYL